MTPESARRAPMEGFQLDLATLLGRLRQIEREGAGESPHWLMDRVLTCDLPRMVKYLTPETLARLRMTDADGYWTPDAGRVIAVPPGYDPHQHDRTAHPRGHPI